MTFTGCLQVKCLDYLFDTCCDWKHWITNNTDDLMEYLAGIVDPVFIRGAVDMSIDAKRDDIYESIEISGGDCINIPFDRKERYKPEWETL